MMYRHEEHIMYGHEEKEEHTFIMSLVLPNVRPSCEEVVEVNTKW